MQTNLIALLFLLLFASCSPSLYFPDKVVTTSFDEKNKLQLNVSAKPQLNATDSPAKKGHAFSFSADAAYSFSNHFGGYIYYTNLSNRAVSENNRRNIFGLESLTGGNFDGNRIELGAVYFSPAAKDQVIELAFGYSRGNTNRTSKISDSNNFQSKYFTIFLQPSWSVKGKLMIFSMGAKLWVHKYNYFSSSPYVQQLFTDNTTFLTQHYNIGVQPYMNLEAGLEKIKFSIQGSNPLLFNSKKYNLLLGGFPLCLSAGISIMLDNKMFRDLKSRKNENQQ